MTGSNSHLFSICIIFGLRMIGSSSRRFLNLYYPRTKDDRQKFAGVVGFNLY